MGDTWWRWWPVGAAAGPWIGFAWVASGVVLSIVVIAAVLVLLPQDHFVTARGEQLRRLPAAARVIVTVAKNLLGVGLVGVGVVLSVPGVPGQGVLTILLGVTLIDLPVLRRVERRILHQPPVRVGIDGLRRRFGKAPLQWPDP